MEVVGQAITRTMDVMKVHWSQFAVIACAVLGIMLVSLLLCILPSMIVAGPLIVGSFGVAFAALRGERPEIEHLKIGQRRLGAAIGMFFIFWLLQNLLYFILMAVFAVIFFAISASGSQSREIEMIANLASSCGSLINLPYSFWIGTRLMFAFPIIADDPNAGAIEACKRSWRMTQGNFWPMLLLYMGATLVSSLGLMACIVGVVFTSFIYPLVIGAAYLYMTYGSTSGESDVADDLAPYMPPPTTN